MRRLRDTLHRSPALVALLLVLTLALKAALPAGLMLRSAGPLVLTVEVCADATGAHAATRQIVIPRADDGARPAEKQDGSCAYTALGALWTGAVPPALAVLALAFLIALGFAAKPRPALRAAPFLRPPLRGPPTPA